MAWRITDDVAGSQAIAETSTTQKHPLGTIVRAVNDTAATGAGEFIYLLGVASTVVGDVVNYDGASWQTALHSNVILQPTPVAVAMSANVASQYGWYQIAGNATVRKASALSIADGLGVGATSGAIVSITTGLCISGCAVTSVAAAGSTSGTVMLDRPCGPPSADAG